MVFITTAQLHSFKPELRFCASSNPASGVSEIVMMRISGNGPAGNKANKPLSSVNHATKII